jgi:3-oxoacyl-[acyl-carrier protein] reductase
MNRYFERVALVTGASRGIGLAIAKRILSEGGKVVITARKPEALAEAVLELGGSEFALAVAGSADDPEHQDETVRRAIETFGRIDVLVNNCGINPHYGDLLDVDYSAAKKIFDVNVIATLSWTKKVTDAWLSKNGGAVVNVASLAGIKPETGIGMYGVSKAALFQVTRQLAVELGPNIRVNAVAPAVVKTKFAEKLFEGKEAELSKRYAVGRLGEPEDVAAAVAFLGSSDAAWITGQILTLDGGVTLTGGF